MNYNSSQRAALEHNTGPCLVLAGPGSGKTAVITARLGFLLDNCRIKPEKILVITFTKASALEMQERFYQTRGKNTESVQFGTFHAIYFQILSHTFRYTFQNIITPNEKRKMMKKAIQKVATETETQTLDAEILLSHISNLKNMGMKLENYAVDFMEKECFDKIYIDFETRKREANKLDFDDMVLQCYELFCKRPEILKQWQQRFSYILIDEFQDINSLQYQVVKMLAAPENNLFVVGDDDQSIYGFRGASPGIMKEFLSDYKKAKTMLLDVNYRCSYEIVEASLKCINENKERMYKEIKANAEKSGRAVVVKEFTDRQEEYAYIVDEILKQNEQYNYSEMAVIFRTNKEMEGLSHLLAKEKIPFVMKEKSKSIFEHFIAKDFVQKISGSSGTRRPYLEIQYLRKKSGYNKFLEDFAGRDVEKNEEFQRIADEIQNSAKPFSTLKEWQDYMENYVKGYHEKPKEKETGVNLVTMHGAKGLEYDCVWIVNVNEGTIPHGKELSEEAVEEERRLLYVAMTRARQKLEMFCVKGTKETPKRPSRFLNAFHFVKVD